MRGTPIGWPLRAWFVVEVFFGLAAIASLTLRPADTATGFAWTIKPEVMAATIGAFYLALAPSLLLATFAKRWEAVRVLVVPGMLFTLTELVVTFLHWDRFAVGSGPFWLWFLSYLLPPPVFLACYLWQQRRSTPMPPAEPLAGWARVLLYVIGGFLTFEAVAGLFYPGWWSDWAPWKITPLNARALSGYVLLLGLMMIGCARENDRERLRIASPFLILVLPAVVLQVRRFAEQADLGHPRIFVALPALAIVCLLGLYLFRGSWRRTLGA